MCRLHFVYPLINYTALGFYVNRPEFGRQLVIPDVHGCARTLHALLDTVNLQPKDQLFFLGDLVNKGPRSPAVLETVMALQKQHSQVYVLRGNHEQLYLTTSEKEPNKMADYAAQNFTGKMLEQGKFPQRYLDYFSSLPLYLELNEYWLVHAGFNFDLPGDAPWRDAHSMMYIREMDYDEKRAKGKTIIHGHTPTPIQEIERSLKSQHRIVSLDNGCVYYGKRPNQGYLLCLDLNSGALIKQVCID